MLRAERSVGVWCRETCWRRTLPRVPDRSAAAFVQTAKDAYSHQDSLAQGDGLGADLRCSSRRAGSSRVSGAGRSKVVLAITVPCASQIQLQLLSRPTPLSQSP